MRVAVLGLGSAGRRHASNLAERGVDVVGWDPSPRPEIGVTRAGSAEAAVGQADAVVVASPNAFHGGHAELALRSGVPVLVEKPLAVSLPEAERIAEISEETGVTCAVAMNLRFLDGLRELRRQVESGHLGRVLFVSSWFGYDLRKWRPGSDYRESYSARAELGGGILLDAIHEIDYLLWMFGPAESVLAETAHVSDLDIDVEDSAVAAIRLRSGGLIALSINFVEAAYRRGCVVAGSRATADWDLTRESIGVSTGDDRREVSVSNHLAESYRAEMDDFISSVSEGASPTVGVREGVEAVRLADAIARSGGSGKRIRLDWEGR